MLDRESLEIVDRERERLGRELHDGLCQSLAGIAALASTLAKNLQANGEPMPAAAAAEIARLLNDAIGEARDLAHSLTPIGPGRADLRGALENLARGVNRAYPNSCVFTSDDRWPRLGPEIEAHLLRIAQEAVNNAIVHGRADHIHLRLECGDGFGRLTVRDDGAGLAEDYRDRDGIGLGTMDYRARAIGGTLAVARCSPRGSAVDCAFRLPGTRETE